MTLLLDTHVPLWFITGDPALTADLVDRLLVARAIVEGLTLVTRDASIAQYDVALLKA
ncbi:hypothetical protein [Actinoplanes subglobosus]|uniref:Uncharacterized protein n=1 Tax=Actinoplanes subglobosus TaxID=1547892 RepID=A0ABV8J1R5_9ACTN